MDEGRVGPAGPGAADAILHAPVQVGAAIADARQAIYRVSRARRALDDDSYHIVLNSLCKIEQLLHDIAANLDPFDEH